MYCFAVQPQQQIARQFSGGATGKGGWREGKTGILVLQTNLAMTVHTHSPDMFSTM